MVVAAPDMSTRALSEVSKWLEIVQFWLLPGTCVVCRRHSGRPFDLCPNCEGKLVRVQHPCASCGLPLPPDAEDRCGRCLLQKRRIVRTIAPFAWAEPVSTLVAGYKYRDALQQGRVLAELLLAELQVQYQSDQLPDLLIPVPLHKSRLRARGYNQSLLLARQLGQGLGIPVASEQVVRVLSTPPQQGLSARARRRNLRHAFRMGDMPLPDNCRTIALVDDVVTTMSTVHALARLLQVPQRRQTPLIHVWALARA